MSLLPANMLTNIRLGVSASPSADLGRLGLLEAHFRLALGELARTVLILGGRLQYCGHLDPDGYTVFLIEEVKRYGRYNDPLSLILASSVHRKLALSEIQQTEFNLGLFGTITYLDTDGTPVGVAVNRQEDAPGLPDDQIAASLTAMRRYAIEQSQGRLLLGGRKTGYQGKMPGVLEEVLIAIELEQPVYIAGGYGGVAHSIVAEIESEAASWLPPSGDDVDAGLEAGLKTLSGVISGRGWAALANGLEPIENRQLAATHRPSEIAALVSLGLGRLAHDGVFSPESMSQG